MEKDFSAMIYYVRAAVHLVLFVVFVWVVKSDMDFLPAELLPIPGYSLSKLAWLTIVDLVNLIANENLL